MYPARSGAGPEAARQRSSRIDGDAGPALAGSDAGQELGLSRVARTHRGWIDAASVHRLLLRAGPETRCLPARLHPSDATDAESSQRLGGSGGGRARIGGRREAAGRHHGGADRHSSSDRQHVAVGCGPRRHAPGRPSGESAGPATDQGVLRPHTLGAAPDVRDPAHDDEAAPRAADPGHTGCSSALPRRS